LSPIESWLIDMDGVLVREEHPIPGADRFLERLRERGAPFLVLTNNSMYTPRDLAAFVAAGAASSQDATSPETKCSRPPATAPRSVPKLDRTPPLGGENTALAATFVHVRSTRTADALLFREVLRRSNPTPNCRDFPMPTARVAPQAAGMEVLFCIRSDNRSS